MDRRRSLSLIAGLGLGAGALAAGGVKAATPSNDPVPRSFGPSQMPFNNGRSRMKHRTYSGKILYNSDGVGEDGRELFTVTIQPDGTRTLRAQVEIDKVRVLRDSILTVDKDFYPIDAFSRLTKEEQFVGSTWYRFGSHTAECEGYTVEEGRIHHAFETEERISLFTCHPINCDAWLWGAARRSADHNVYPWFNTSLSGYGDTGPTLFQMTPGRAVVTPVAVETITTPAGAFAAQHYQLGSRGSASVPLDTWVYGQDCVPIRLRSEGNKQTYELVELHGDVV